MFPPLLMDEANIQKTEQARVSDGFSSMKTCWKHAKMHSFYQKSPFLATANSKKIRLSHDEGTYI